MSKAKNAWKRRVGWGVLLAGFLGLVALASMPRPVAVETASVTRGALEVLVEEVGQTRVKDRYTLSAPIAGNLLRIGLEEGDEVSTEDTVAHILPVRAALLDSRSRATAEARVAAAQANLRRARISVTQSESTLAQSRSEAERFAQLVEAGGVSRQEAERADYQRRSAQEALVSSRFGVRVATHEVRMAQAALGRLDGGGDEQLPIPSPVAGRVLRVFQRSEAVVQPGQPLIEVGDPSHLEVVVDVLTTEAVRISPGDPVRVVRWGGEGSLSARVRLVEPSAFTERSALGVEEQRVNVVIDLLDPPDAWSALGDAYRVEAEIVVERIDDALQVPGSAVFRHGDGFAVYAVRGDTAVRVPVEVVARSPDAVAIGATEDGLRVDDTVVVHPGDAVDDGVEVQVAE